MLAGFTGIAELQLADDEARAMASAIAEVNRHYRMPGLKPEHAALLGLGAVTIQVYGGKVKAVMAKAGKGKGKAPAPAAGGPVAGVVNGTGSGIPASATATDPASAAWLPSLQ